MVTLFAGLFFASQVGFIQLHDEGAWIRHNISYYAKIYGVDEYEAQRVAYCESRFSNVLSEYWPKEDSYGPFQEKSSFWTNHATDRGMVKDPLSRKSIEANIEMAIYVASINGWDEWSCKPGSYWYNKQKAEVDKILGLD